MIEVENVSKRFKIYRQPSDRLKELLSFGKKSYHHEFWALRDVSLRVADGETVGIIGRNGSGKSTLLKVIAGVLLPTEGSARSVGRVAALLELGAGFNPELTGRENIFINGALQGFSAQEMKDRYEDIVAFADIGEFINYPVKKYSSGMYVRLAFSCAINVDPDILIVDEALSVGDELFQRKCFLKFEHFQKQGKTILFVSHSSITIKQVCSRAVLLDHGKVHAEGEPNEIINEYTRLNSGSKSRTAAVAPSPAKRTNGLAKQVSISVTPSDRKDVLALDADEGAEVRQEYRYGNGAAEILEVRVRNEAGDGIDTLVCDEQCTVTLKVKFTEAVERPIYALTMKNLQGVEVYGTNTWYKGLEFEPRAAGDVVEVAFHQRLNLIAGNYYLSVGCVSLEGEDIVPLDRRYDQCVIKVLPVDRDFGISYLNSSISIAVTDQAKL